MPFARLLELAWRDLRAGGRPLAVFALCLALGVTLVAAGGTLHRQVAASLGEQVRGLFGGDVELESPTALPEAEQRWWRERGRVTELVQLRTMMVAEDGRSQLVELTSVDAAYPLVGTLELEPAGTVASLLAPREGVHGVAVDPVLAQRLGLVPGSRVELGDLTLEVRAVIRRQSDRSLRAEWRGAPVLIAQAALDATGLVQPTSRVEHKLRVASAEPPRALRQAYFAAFPDSRAEVRTVADRSDRIAEVLGQVGSGLLLVGFTALGIGGLGVFNSVHAYLQGKLKTWATLRAIGLRDGRLLRLVLLQVTMLALAASTAGALAGTLLAAGGLALAGERLPVAWQAQAVLAPLALAIGFGLLTAWAFAWPAITRALATSPAALFRGDEGLAPRTPARGWVVAGLLGAGVVALMLAVLPDPRFGLGFIAVVVLLLALLEGASRGIAAAARRLLARGDGRLPFEAGVALAALARPGSPLKPALLSLGTALALLVASTVVVAALLRTIDQTLPASAPGLVFHDVQEGQQPLLDEALAAAPSLARVEIAPLVLGRVHALNGTVLADSPQPRLQRAARDEHKFSHRGGDIDDVILQQGAWWPAGYTGAPLVAMEDREAERIGAQVGDRLVFEILGQPVEAELVAIYGQRRVQARLWLEAIFSDGVLDPFITRHVGAAWLDAADAIAAQDRLAAAAPNIVTVRTQALLDTTRQLLAQASAALAVAGGACLAASLLVLASVVAASRQRQVYEATVMHVLGARLGRLRRVLRWEYGLIGAVTALFGVLAGGAIAQGLLAWRLGLDGSGLMGLGALVALLVSALALGSGARSLLQALALAPAQLLRRSA